MRDDERYAVASAGAACMRPRERVAISELNTFRITFHVPLVCFLHTSRY